VSTLQVDAGGVLDALHALPIAVFTWDEQGVATSWNDAATVMLGWLESDVVGRPLPFEIQAGGAVSARTKNGHVLEVTVSSAPIRGADGEPLGFLGIAHELVDERLGEFFELSSDLHVIADFEGRFIRVNSAWERTLGHSTETLLAEPFTSFIHPDDVNVTASVYDGQQADGAAPVLLFTNRYRHVDGSYRSLQWVSTSYPERGLIYAMARDVTALIDAEKAAERAREDLERASHAKSEFLSRMSHELRTPLNAILGFGQLLELNELGAEDADSVTQILKAGHHLLQMINEILDISRIEAGRLALSLEPVAVGELVEDTLSLIAPLAAERSLKLTSDMEHGDLFVLADRQRLKQVLLNLLSNAIKYNHDGGSIDLSVSAASGDRLRISVVDTGLGIAPEDLGRAFEPFDRLDASAGTEGTGLGLALSKGLVEAMGGTIGAESSRGFGSTFWLELATVEGPTVAHDSHDEHGETDISSTSGRQATVLYVEDNVSNLRLIKRLLAARPNVELLAAMQGQIGLDLAREHRPDLILLDLHLPDLSGEDVLARLTTDPRTAGIPVVVLSADATHGRLERLRRAGAADYLTKPLDVRHFLEVVDGLLADSAS